MHGLEAHPGSWLWCPAGQDWPEWDGEQGEPSGRRAHVRAGVDTPRTQKTQRGSRLGAGPPQRETRDPAVEARAGQLLTLASGGETEHRGLTQLQQAQPP